MFFSFISLKLLAARYPRQAVTAERIIDRPLQRHISSHSLFLYPDHMCKHRTSVIFYRITTISEYCIIFLCHRPYITIRLAQRTYMISFVIERSGIMSLADPSPKFLSYLSVTHEILIHFIYSIRLQAPKKKYYCYLFC